MDDVNDIKDKTLTSKERKSLPKSQFCGPDDSFPVPDCKHVKAALSLLGRYKGPGNKDTIRACIYKRAKALNCFKKTEDSIDDSLFDSLDLILEFQALIHDGFIDGAEGVALLLTACSAIPSITDEDVVSILQKSSVSLSGGFSMLIAKYVDTMLNNS